MRGFRLFPAMAAASLAVWLIAFPARAEDPRPAEPAMTTAPRAEVRIVLPSGEVVVLPVEPDASMTPNGNSDHVVGEELC